MPPSQFDVVVTLPAALDSSYASVRQFIVERCDVPMHQRGSAFWRPGAFWIPEGQAFRWFAHGALGPSADRETLLLEILPTSRGPILAGNFDDPVRFILGTWLSRVFVAAFHLLGLTMIAVPLTLELTKAPFRILAWGLAVAAFFYFGGRPFRKAVRFVSPDERLEQRKLILEQLCSLGTVVERTAPTTVPQQVE